MNIIPKNLKINFSPFIHSSMSELISNLGFSNYICILLGNFLDFFMSYFFHL